MLGQATNGERNELTFLEGQMGQMRMEGNRDRHEVDSLVRQQERLTDTLGTDDHFYEVIPGYTKKPDKNSI